MLPQLFLFILNKNCFNRNYGLPISEIKGVAALFILKE
jgi:hypothetical protein